MTLIYENRIFYSNSIASGLKNINHKFVSLYVTSPVKEDDKAFSQWPNLFLFKKISVLPYFKTAVLKVEERGETFNWWLGSVSQRKKDESEDAGDTCEPLVELLAKSPDTSSAAPRAAGKVKTWSKVCKKDNVTDCFINSYFYFHLPIKKSKEKQDVESSHREDVCSNPAFPELGATVQPSVRVIDRSRFEM